MRFWCIIGILFFLTLKNSEATTQASCTMKSIKWWVWPQNLKTCYPNINWVYDENFTISSDDRSTLGLELEEKKGLYFLPTNVSGVFPDLIAFHVEKCSITTVYKNHFKNLSKLKLLDLCHNKIKHVASDAFADLVGLDILLLNDNKIESLSADTFSSLKALKRLRLDENRIQQLDRNIFKSLVEVEIINLGENSIASLNEKIFKSLTNLKEIVLFANKLKTIPGNLFKNNLMLEKMYLEKNEIKFIGANVFDHLPNLNSIDLRGNACLNKTYDTESVETKSSSCGKRTFTKKSLNKIRSDLARNCSAALEHACGVPKHAFSLIKGENFARGAFPWIVALMLAKLKPHEFFCAATLISETFVISGNFFLFFDYRNYFAYHFTAAHCILNKGAASELLPRDILAIFGAHDLNNPDEPGRIVRSPVKIFIHENWNHQITNYDADISLLKFHKNKIHFSDFIQPICLWNSEIDPNVASGVVTGWGRSEDTTKIHENWPKLIPAPILTNERCWLDDPGLITISSERIFCAGLRNGSGVCQGDSGGGHFIEVDGLYHLEGIVSSSKVTDQGCDVTRNAVYTNVLKFRDWIEEKTQQTIKN